MFPAGFLEQDGQDGENHHAEPGSGAGKAAEWTGRRNGTVNGMGWFCGMLSIEKACPQPESMV